MKIVPSVDTLTVMLVSKQLATVPIDYLRVVV